KSIISAISIPLLFSIYTTMTAPVTGPQTKSVVRMAWMTPPTPESPKKASSKHLDRSSTFLIHGERGASQRMNSWNSVRAARSCPMSVSVPVTTVISSTSMRFITLRSIMAMARQRRSSTILRTLSISGCTIRRRVRRLPCRLWKVWLLLIRIYLRSFLGS
ncbi:hypothetical protein KEM54_006475, partial [Ascosphaera aggregata]